MTKSEILKLLPAKRKSVGFERTGVEKNQILIGWNRYRAALIRKLKSK